MFQDQFRWGDDSVEVEQPPHHAITASLLATGGGECSTEGLIKPLYSGEALSNTELKLVN